MRHLVLFANEKSKNEDLDTVYEYSGVEFDKDGHCVSLTGFSFHIDRKGFRLPTEAEWVKLTYTKTSKVKLVFKNEATGNLTYID